MAEGIKDILTWQDDNGTMHAINVDLVTSHEDDRTAQITSHPVEKGADINDHIVHNPDTLTLEIAQTQSPLPSPARPGVAFTAPKGFAKKSIKLEVRPSQFQPGGLLAVSRAVGAAVGAAVSAIGGALGLPVPGEQETKVQVFTNDAPVDRIGELHDVLINVKQKGHFCTVTFRGRIYPNYLITRVKWSSAKGESGLGRFSLDLQSVRIVETAVAQLPDPASLRLKPAKTFAKPLKPVEDPKPDAKGKLTDSSLLDKATGLGVPSS